MGLIIGKIFSVLAIILVGFIGNKRNVLPDESEPYLNRMLFDIIIPGMIITTITTREFTKELASMTLQMILVSIAFFLLYILTGLVISKLIFKKEPTLERGVMIATFSSFNTALIGFPISNALFGPEVMYLVVLVNLVMTVYVFVFMPFVMNIGSSSNSMHSLSKKELFRGFAKSLLSPAPLSVFVSMAMLFMGLRFPPFIEDFLSIVGSGTTVVSMLIVGIQLGKSNIREVIKNSMHMIFFFIKMLVLPFIVFFLINGMDMSVEIKIAAIFCSTLPAGITPSPMASTYGHDPTPAAESIVVTCILSMFTMTIGAMFITNFYNFSI